MTNYKQIREALAFSDLTEDEKKDKGILTRLYGPCASVIESTRNGRTYSDELWENVFTKNEIVREMFENGGCPMELDHPVGREETDSSRIAAMIPEPPKKDKDGHLICYVDIIDTPCGKIAYQLAKYGFKLGISSRGSGDVLADDTVDPDTYDFTTFDLVLLPAVKDARLSMCESLDKNKIKLKSALTEELNKLDNDADKKVMLETLKDLNINLDEDNEEDSDEDYESEYTVELEPLDDKEDSDDEFEGEDTVELEPQDDEEESNKKDSKEEKEKVFTVGDLQKELKDFDKDLNIKFNPIVIDGKEYPIEMLDFDDSEKDVVVVNVGYSQESGDNIDSEEDKDEAKEIEAEVADDEKTEDKVEDKSEEVIDDESEEVIENLKEAIRQKDLLENEIKNLKNESTVRDAEVKTLSEELNKYKVAFARTSVIAADAKKSEVEVKNLTEQLNKKDISLKQKDIEISELKKFRAAKLNENVQAERNKIKVLTENLESAKQEAEQKTNQLTEQANIYKKKLNECTGIAKKYKAQADEVLNEYINFRAKMLGVRPDVITSKLNENFSISDINDACDGILAYGMPNVSFNLNRSSKMKITESKQNPDDDLEDLYILAGLK